MLLYWNCSFVIINDLLFLVILMTFLKMFPLKLDCMQMMYCYIIPFKRTKEECLTLQEDLNTLQLWANKWQMMFNPDKC